MSFRSGDAPVASERRRNAAFLAMCFALAAWASPVRPGIVLGESMAPTFQNGQIFLKSRLLNAASVEPGDVVLARVGGITYLKRVYAVGGETVWGVASESGAMEQIVPRSEVRRWRLGLRQRPPQPQRELIACEVPPGHVFVLGDARNNSYDSRNFGPVSMEAVEARVVVSHLFRLWAPSEAGTGVAVAGGR